MTRGAGRSRGYRAKDSELRPGKVVVPFGEKTLICPACRCEYTAQDFLLLYNLQPEPEEAA